MADKKKLPMEAGHELEVAIPPSDMAATMAKPCPPLQLLRQQVDAG